MSEIINLEDSFENWFHAVESYELKSERFYRVINEHRTREGQAKLIVDWLKAAYMQGAKIAAQDSVDTLRDYSISLAGIGGFTYNPDEAYSACAVSLDCYWQDVFKDKE